MEDLQQGPIRFQCDLTPLSRSVLHNGRAYSGITKYFSSMWLL
jgi:hypothetical protein